MIRISTKRLPFSAGNDVSVIPDSTSVMPDQIGHLFAKSKWWGFPDLPEDLDWPSVPVNDEGDEYDDPLTFICQLRCDELAPFDSEGLLPHEGMLYFFAALDYFLGNLDAAVAPGLGEWEAPYFKVLYSPSVENLHTHSLLYDDGSPACLPEEAISFNMATGGVEVRRSFLSEAARGGSETGLQCPGAICDGTGLLGHPFFEEVESEMPGMISLLQIDENDDWGLRFFDCGMLNFLISPEDLAARRWNQVKVYLHSA